MLVRRRRLLLVPRLWGSPVRTVKVVPLELFRGRFSLPFRTQLPTKEVPHEDVLSKHNTSAAILISLVSVAPMT